MKAASLVLLCAVVVACGAPPAPRLDVPSKAFDKPFDVTWKAVVEVLSKANLDVRNAEKEAGTIRTGWQTTDKSNCECGSLPTGNFRPQYRVKLDILVKKATDSSTEVRIDGRFQRVDVAQSHSVTTSCESTGRLEQEILENILGFLR
jgi:uncharacterized lipoprotein